jgi:predicted TIM-barrel fold metal-dependent hydrolase
MFGTNSPQLTWDACITSADDQLRLKEEVKADFFGGNAERVLKLDESRQLLKGKL